MSDIDYSALRGEIGGEPPDGEVEAVVTNAVRLDTSKGPMIKVEWQSIDAHQYVWENWYGLFGNRIGFAREFLRDAGVKVGDLGGDDDLDAALSGVMGTIYRVRVSHNGAFLNLDVLGTAEAQAQLDIDLPTAEVEIPSSSVPDDDKIPF
jgi:hypothetical protein